MIAVSASTIPTFILTYNYCIQFIITLIIISFLFRTNLIPHRNAYFQLLAYINTHFLRVVLFIYLFFRKTLLIFFLIVFSSLSNLVPKNSQKFPPSYLLYSYVNLHIVDFFFLFHMLFPCLHLKEAFCKCIAFYYLKHLVHSMREFFVQEFIFLNPANRTFI